MDAGRVSAASVLPKASTESHAPSQSTATTAYMGSVSQFPGYDGEKDEDAARPSENLESSQQLSHHLDDPAERDGRVKNEVSGFEPTEYPSGTRLATVTLALVLAVFCVALDNTV